MTPEQALHVVAQMCALAHVTKADHIAADQALQVLTEFVKGSSSAD